jgi:hypothetical protein
MTKLNVISLRSSGYMLFSLELKLLNFRNKSKHIKARVFNTIATLDVFQADGKSLDV